MSGEGVLNVVTSFVRELAGKQDEVASELSVAANAVDGTPENVALTHGTASEATNSALEQYVSIRKAAATGMQSVSTKLSRNLNTAAEAYDNTDSDSATRLNRPEFD